MMSTYDADKLPPWPRMPDGWSDAAIVPRRTSPLSIGAIVFVLTDTRVYRKAAGATYGTGGPIERYRYEVRKIVGETRVSWLLASYDRQVGVLCDKVPKRDLSKIYGRDDVEDVLWIGAHQHKIARAVGDLRGRGPGTRAKLQAIADLLEIDL
jgi:hypothetical protein